MPFTFDYSENSRQVPLGRREVASRVIVGYPLEVYAKQPNEGATKTIGARNKRNFFEAFKIRILDHEIIRIFIIYMYIIT